MTNSHADHDSVLDNEVTLVSGALLGGHVQVGRKAIISGDTGVHQFVSIAELAMLGGVAMISSDIPPFTMTDHRGAVVGLNSVGLMRDGLTSDDRDEFKHLFKINYRSGMQSQRAIELASELAMTDPCKGFVAFFNADSRRGVRKIRDRKSRSELRDKVRQNPDEPNPL